jgi:SAM-dependent methyltransferase
LESQIRRQFLNDYSHIRRAEGRGSDDPEYYRALPYQDLSGRNQEQWSIRARSYQYFSRFILTAIEKETRRPLRILDAGAGNGWLSYRLTLRDHIPVALDIFADSRDGLRAARHYPKQFARVEGEFDQLPFHDGSFDLIIYNSSIHYSTDYRRTLSETKRCLKQSGRVVIMDSPVYKCHEHGIRMRNEKHEHFERQYGFRSDTARSIEFFDEAELAALARDLNIDWQRSRPWYGLQWAMRPLLARLASKRPPSRFFILAGKFRDA